MALGPCKVLTWNVEMMGDFESISRVVEWIENGERLIRIDKIVFQMKGDKLSTAMVMKGIVLDTPPEKRATTKPVRPPAFVGADTAAVQ